MDKSLTISFAVAEAKQVTGKRTEFQLLGNHDGQSVNLPTPIGGTGSETDLGSVAGNYQRLSSRVNSLFSANC